jgi:hypothetical protein
MPTTVTLHISIFRMKTGSAGPIGNYITAATQLLQRYNMRLDVHPADLQPIEIDFVWTVDADAGHDAEDSDAAKVRYHASLAFDDQATPLRFPVIMWPVSQSDKGGKQHGVTEVNFDNVAGQGRKTVDGVTWLPYTIINSASRDLDDLALVHEMGHGALCRHPGDGPDRDNVASSDLANIMRTPDSTLPVRSTINKKQMRAIANAYFASPRIAF